LASARGVYPARGLTEGEEGQAKMRGLLPRRYQPTRATLIYYEHDSGVTLGIFRV